MIINFNSKEKNNLSQRNETRGTCLGRATSLMHMSDRKRRMQSQADRQPLDLYSVPSFCFYHF